MNQKNQAVVFRSSGLHCDNPNCDWADDTIAFEDYHKHVNAPCPKCGENILTQEDFESAQAIKDFADLMQELAEKMELPETTEDDTTVTISFTSDGSGKLNVSMDKK